MTEKRLTDCISRETLERLTQEAFEEPARRRRPALRRGLALAACLVLVVLAVNFDTVYAAARRFFYFIPGNGPVAEEEGTVYWLPEEEYHVSTGKAEYTVTYLYRRDTTLSCWVEKKMDQAQFPEEEMAESPGEEDGNGGQAAPSRVIPGLKVEFLDPEGNPIPGQETWSHSVYDATQGGAVFGKAVTLENFTWEEFTLVLDGTVKLPVRLRQVNPEQFSLEHTLVASNRGYTLSLLPLNSSCTRFALIPAPAEEKEVPVGRYWSALSFHVKLLGEDGLWYEAEYVNSAPGCQELYVPGLPHVKMEEMTVTGLLESTRYEKSAVVLQVPPLEPGEEVELDQPLELDNITLFPSSAGLDPDGRLWVNLDDWDDGNGRRLNQVDLSWPESKSHGGSIIRNDSCTIYHEGMSGYAGKSLELPVTFVSVVQEGEWSFSLRE
jgi:hypothetical protein